MTSIYEIKGSHREAKVDQCLNGDFAASWDDDGFLRVSYRRDLGDAMEVARAAANGLEIPAEPEGPRYYFK